MTAYTIPSAEPFFLPGGEIGCLLIHGFTGAPKEMRWMGEYLAGQGRTVLGIRLSGHATNEKDMLRARWQDWAASVEDGWHILSGTAKKIFVIGLSMGGVLSLFHAARFPVHGIVAMSTPYNLPPDPRLPFLRWLHWLIPFAAKKDSDWIHPEMAEDHIHYPHYPTQAILELKVLLAEMRTRLPQISAPTLLMHSRQDQGVAPENMPKIYAELGAQDKEMLWIENSGHVLTRDAARQEVFATAEAFIRRVS